jgi:hypothetical protein
MHARQIGPLNLGAKPYVRQKSQIAFVGAGYRALLAATDSNQHCIEELGSLVELCFAARDAASFHARRFRDRFRAGRAVELR